MNDQNPVVDDVVAQASAIQNLFKLNDSAQPSGQQPTDPIAQPPVSQQAPSDQKSPLDILEEILSKEKSKADEVVPTGPTPEELQLIQQQQQQEQAMIEEARQKMMTETQSDEQKKRDTIRQQQIDSNKIENPFTIRQLEHKKITR